MINLKSDFKKSKPFSKKMYNSVVRHLGVDRTCKTLKLRGHNWVGMKEDLSKYLLESIICQKIKWQRPADWEDFVDHHLYSVILLQELSIETLGTFPEDEYGMSSIILIVDNVSSMVCTQRRPYLPWSS